MFSPLATTLADTDAADTKFGTKIHSKQSVRLAEGSIVSSFISLLHPKGRGSVVLRSADPDEQPTVEFPFLSGEGDVEDLTAACRRVREIFDSPAMRPFVLGESLPGPAVETDAEWEEFIRAMTHGAAHWAGTAKIGAADDPAAVVDPELRVRGVEGLRVADASVMPTLTSGNTNAPSIMIGEKAAFLIKHGARAAAPDSPLQAPAEQSRVGHGS